MEYLRAVAVRTIRCGRCRYEFIVGGVPETTCPQCGARNRIPGAPEPAATTTATATAPGAPPEPEPEPEPGGPRWVVCPNCSYRFAVGGGERGTHPPCAAA